MGQKLAPDAYASLNLPDQWIEDEMQQVEARWLVEQTRRFPRLLDLGWGSGIVAKALAADGREMQLVDGAIVSVQEANKVPGIYAVHAMFEEFNPLAKFDCVIASFVLEHVVSPVALLKRATAWAPRLIAVVGNSESWHRKLAVRMGLQPAMDTLSARDHAVGHYRVYSFDSIERDLNEAGWKILYARGLMFKPLPNSMMTHFDSRLIRAMCEMPVEPSEAANIGIVCERV